MELPGPTRERILDTWPVARLASVSPAGAPHAVPVVFARADGFLWVPVDGKPKRDGELARLVNLRANPRACLLLDAYDDDWTRLWWLRVDADARVVRPAEPARDPEVARAVDALRARYPQYAETPVLRDPPTLIRLSPRAASGWCASPVAIGELG